MKKAVLAIICLLAQGALACPGSNLMTLKFDGQPAYVLDMRVGKITRAPENKDVTLTSLSLDDANICFEASYSDYKCSDMFPSLNITGGQEDVNMMGQPVNLQVELTKGKVTKKIFVARFPGLARGFGGCGPAVEAN